MGERVHRWNVPEPKLKRWPPLLDGADLDSVSRVLRRVKVGRPDSCWLWTGPVNRGYGGISSGRRRLGAHRVVYESFIGPIPSGYVVRHKCDVPACCNPRHLEVGTVADNNRDRDARGRTASGERSPHCKYSAEVIVRLRELYAIGTPVTHAAEIVGMPESTAYNIVHGKTWKSATYFRGMAFGPETGPAGEAAADAALRARGLL